MIGEGASVGERATKLIDIMATCTASTHTKLGQTFGKNSYFLLMVSSSSKVAKKGVAAAGQWLALTSITVSIKCAMQ
jgi:hypothetical protein